MNHRNENIQFTMLQQQCQFSRHHSLPMIYNYGSVKKSFSLDNLNVFLTLEEGKTEDISINTAALSDPFLEREKVYKNNSNRPSNERNVDEDVISHDAIIVSPGRIDDNTESNINEYDQSNDKDEDQAVSDVPTIITHTSSIDSISTIGVDSSLNDNPRSIFSNYWDTKNPEVVPEVVISRSSTHCNSGTSTSVQSSPIHEHILENTSHSIHFPETTYKEYAMPHISRRNSTCSDTQDYETALRRYEVGRTTIPRAAALNDPIGTTITNIPNNRDNSSQNDGNDSPVNQKLQHPPKPTQQRKLFSNDFSSYVSNLSSYRYSDDHILKTSSTSALFREQILRRQRSCLRPLSRSKSAVIAGRVTFNPNVSVLEYDRPVSNYASHGWSKWFV